MNGLIDGFILNVMVCLADKPSGHWNMRSCWRVSQAMGPKLKNYGEMKPFGLWSVKWNGLQTELLRSNSRLGSLIILSGAVHTGVEVCRMDLEMSGLVKWPWLQLMYCTICLLCGRNFRWWREVQDGSECWLVYCCWILEIEFNKSLSLSIIRLANYSVTTSLIYKMDSIGDARGLVVKPLLLWVEVSVLRHWQG